MSSNNLNHLKKVQVTLPVYNEEVQLESSVLQLLDFCQQNQLENIVIYIADNGSSDRTQEIGEALARKFDNVNYLRLDRKGFGLAVKSAWAISDADYLGYMDLDLSTDLKHFKYTYDLFQQSDEYQLVMGSRLKEGSSVKNRTLLREFISRCFNFWLRFNLNVGFTDGMCGFKFIEKKFYDRLAEKFEFTDEWFFATELAVRTEWMRGKILDLPVYWVDDLNSKSSSRIISLTLEYIEGIAKLKKEEKKRRQLLN